MENRGMDRDDVLSRALKAGKRTYFFDVKQTKSGEKYLVITESKKKFDDNDGSFTYEKHKIFLYKEDYDKFADLLSGMITYMKDGIEPPETKNEFEASSSIFDDLKFE
ncbi:MAG: PUR family DNA/RNA-binding protein [Bacteroidales bacterium]|nr:PUR family DNA/RNA-binding protein [Bacteroidales bacterium]